MDPEVPDSLPEPTLAVLRVGFIVVCILWGCQHVLRVVFHDDLTE